MASAILIVLALITPSMTAAQSSASVHEFAPHTPDFDLDGQYVRDALSEPLKQSLILIEQAEKLPSCAKFATTALLHSCSALEGSISHNSQLPPGSDLLLEEESDIYAARLAVCELSGADFSLPAECRSFIPTPGGKEPVEVRGWWPSTGSSKGPSKPRVLNKYYDEVTEANLKQCRKAFGLSSQAWTSYSNNRQNAVVMCHAMQSAVERDESRHIAKILANTAAAATGSMQDAYEQANEFKQQFHELRTGMPKFQEDLATFDTDLQQRIRDYWHEFDRARDGLESLATSVGEVKSDAVEARDLLDEVISLHLPKLAVAVAQASQEIKDTSESTVASTEHVAYAVQRIKDDFVTSMDAAGYGLATINGLMPQLSEVMHSTINNTLSFYEAATTRQLELVAAQNDTLDVLERTHQKATDMDSLMDSHASKLTRSAAAMDRLAAGLAPLAFLADNAVVALSFAACTVTYGLLNFVYWHERVRLLSSLVATAGCSIIFAIILGAFWHLFAPSHTAPHVQWSLRAMLVILDFMVTIPIVRAIGYYVCPPPRPAFPSDDYDPFSPPSPYGIKAWAIWLLEFTMLGRLIPRRGASSFTKSRV